MKNIPNLLQLARTIGEPSRMQMLTLLMEGRALTAKELAYGSHIEPATATSHLQRLLDDQLISVATQGRHKYFQIFSPEVAHAIESLMVLAPKNKLPDIPRHNPLCSARFCYDHLAGKFGVEITQQLIAQKKILLHEKEFIVLDAGQVWFESLGINIEQLQKLKRKFAYPCLDWSERKYHLAGALGAALAKKMLELEWIERHKHTRVITITSLGQQQLAKHFFPRNQ